MPYRANDDLPPPVRNHLPAHPQDIYREAFKPCRRFARGRRAAGRHRARHRLGRGENGPT